jgi:hypothetical protein
MLSAKLNGLDPWARLREVLWRSHSHPSHQIGELVPHSWQPTEASWPRRSHARHRRQGGAARTLTLQTLT